MEVGARDVNGSARALVERHCASYIGVDIEEGPGVDQIADAERLLEVFERERFDVLLSTETVEHIRDWPAAFTQMLGAIKPGGLFILTTRSPGFELHGYPHDHWRFTPSDMAEILASVADVLAIDDDVSYGYPCGVGVIARKRPQQLNEEALLARLRSEIRLFHVRLGGRLSFQRFEEIEREAEEKRINPVSFPDFDAESFDNWRMRQASRADVMGIVSTEGGSLWVAPCDAQQSRIVSGCAAFTVRNPTESAYDITVEIAQLPIAPVRLIWNDDELMGLQLEPVGYHHRNRFDGLLCAPGDGRLEIHTTEANHALIRIHFRAQGLSLEEVSWRTGPAYTNVMRAWRIAVRERDRRIEELADRVDRLEQSFQAENQHRLSVEDHARNLEYLLREAQKDAANHKILTEEANKHANNLEELVRWQERQIESLQALLKRSDSNETSG